MWVTQRHAIAFLKSVKQKPNFHKHSNDKNFSEEKQTNLTIKLLYKTTQEIIQKIVNLILENAMPKAIIEVYFELLVTNFYAQISCSCHSKFWEIISILRHRIAITVFVYINFPASTKMFWLVTSPTNSGQK